MGSTFHLLWARCSGPVFPTASMAIKLWETVTFSELEGGNPALQPAYYGSE